MRLSRPSSKNDLFTYANRFSAFQVSFLYSMQTSLECLCIHVFFNEMAKFNFGCIYTPAVSAEISLLCCLVGFPKVVQSDLDRVKSEVRWLRRGDIEYHWGWSERRGFTGQLQGERKELETVQGRPFRLYQGELSQACFFRQDGIIRRQAERGWRRGGASNIIGGKRHRFDRLLAL
jgi:hypothetical protein